MEKIGMKMNRKWKWLTLIYFFALLVRLAVVFLTDFQMQDGGYLDIAQNLINHGMFFEVIHAQGLGRAWNGTCYACAPPIYPFFLALFSNHLFLLSVWQSLVYSCLPLVVFFISSTLFKHKEIALISALLCCIYPFFVYSSNQLIGLLILANLIYVKEKNTKYVFIVGIIDAIGLLTRENFLPILFVFPILQLAVFENGTPKLIFKKYLILFSVTFLFISPWLMRNYMVLKEPVITSYYGSYTLWLGNNELTHQYLSKGIAAHIEDYIYLEKIDDKDLTSFEKMNELEKGKWLTEKAVDFIKNNPAEFLENALLKFVGLWTWKKEPNPLDSSAENKWKPFLYKVVTVPLFFLSGLGFLILCRREKRLAILFLALFLAYSIPFMVYISAIRMRMPFDILLIILSSFFIIWMRDLAASFFRLKIMFLMGTDNSSSPKDNFF